MYSEIKQLDTKGIATNVLTQKTVLGLVECRNTLHKNVDPLAEFHKKVTGALSEFFDKLNSDVDSPELKKATARILKRRG